MRFFRYVGKQKTIEKVCDLIAPKAQKKTIEEKGCDVIAPKAKKTVVGFGNWSNQGYGISRSCSGPVKEIRKCLSRRQNVLFKNVDERNTSCTCHGCFQKLVNMKADSVVWRRVQNEPSALIDGAPTTTTTTTFEKQKTVVKNVKVHKVLHCRNSVKSASSNVRCGATWNRDVNAAKNLLLLLTTWMDGKERPAAFCVPSSSPTPKTTVSGEANVGAQPTDPHGSVSSLQLLSSGPA
jgi:transposase